MIGFIERIKRDVKLNNLECGTNNIHIRVMSTETNQKERPFSIQNCDYKEEMMEIGDYQIFTRQCVVENAKAVLFLLHGYAEHSGRYLIPAQFFVDNKYNVFLLDLPAHGKSSGELRTYIENYDKYLSVINEFIDRMKKSYDNLPLFFMGHSMGGLLTSMLADTREDIKGFVACSPAYLIHNPIIEYIPWMGPFIAYWFGKNYVSSMSPKEFYNDPERAQDFIEDPLVYSEYTSVNTGFEMFKNGKIEKEREIKCPFYLVHGDSDKLIGVEGAREKSKHLLNEKSKYVEIPGGNHVLLEDQKHQEVLEGIEEWLETLLN